MATERTPPTPAMIRAVEAAANLPAFSVPAVDPAALVPPVVPGAPTEEPVASPTGERGPAGVPGAVGQPGTAGLGGLPGPALTPLLGMIRETVERASSAGIASLVAGSPLTGSPVAPTADPSAVAPGVQTQGQPASPGTPGTAGSAGAPGVSGAIQQAVETTLTALASAQPVASAVSVPPGPGVPPPGVTPGASPPPVAPPAPASAPVLAQHLAAAREAVTQAAPGAAPAVSPAIPPGFSQSVPPPLAPLLPPTQAAPAALPVGSRLPDGSAVPPPLASLLAPGAVVALQAASPGGQATPAGAGASQTMSAGPGVLQARLAAALAAASPGGPSGSVTGQAAAASPNLGTVLTGAPVATAGAGQGGGQAQQASLVPASGTQAGYLASMDAHLARIAETLQRSTPAREQAREQREPAEGKGQDVSLQGILGSALQGVLAGLGNVSPHFRTAASGIGGAVESAADAVSPFFPKKQPEADEPSREPTGGGIDLKGIGRVLERAGPTESAGVAPGAATATEGATTVATGEAAVASGASAATGAATAAGGGTAAAGMAAGGEAAIGGEAVAAGAAGGPIGLIVAAVVAAVAKVVQAFVELPGKMLTFGESVLDSSKHLADYNATISVALAHAEVADIHRDIRVGEGTQGTTAVLAEALTGLKDAMVPQTVGLQNLMSGLASLGARLGELLANLTGPLFDTLGTLGKLMAVIAKILGEMVAWLTKEFSLLFSKLLTGNPTLQKLIDGIKDLDETLDKMLGLKAGENTLFGAALGNIANRPLGSPLRSLRIPPVIP